MKQVLLDANFPKDASGATYHVATRPGQVANRIITVGDPKRAQRIAKFFDGGKILVEVQSQRGYLTLTGLCAADISCSVAKNAGDLAR